MSHRLPLEASSPVLFFSNGIGDHFLNIPAIRAIAQLFPRHLTTVCPGGLGRTLFHDIRCRLVEPPYGGINFDADFVAETIGACDLLISLNPWHSPSVDRLMECLRPDHSVGFFRRFRRWVKLNYNQHSADLAFDIPRALDSSLRIQQFSQPPSLPSQFVDQARRLREFVPKDFRLLAVHTDTKKEKMWPPSRFAHFLKVFLDKWRNFFVLIVGEDDHKLDRGRHRDRIIPAHGLPLATSALLVAQSDIFVGIDSCMLHAADLFRVPGVGIFGSTRPCEWGFRFSRHRHVFAPRGLSRLNEKAVLDAVEELLAEGMRC